MSILARLFPGPWRIKFVTFDDDPSAHELRRALRNRQWAKLQAALGEIVDPHQRSYLIDALSDWEDRPDFIERWPVESPDCAEAWLARGANGIDWAWEARGAGLGKHIKQDAWDRFFERLQAAWNDLQMAAELKPGDAVPYAEMITCGRGLQLEAPEVFSCFERARELGGDLWSAHRNLLTYLCEKWHGSHEQMFHFARSTTAELAEGSGLHTLICVAHFERWAYAEYFDNDASLAARYWNDEFVRDEILAAYHKSLASPRHRATPKTPELRNWFALALARVGAHKEASAEFAKIGDVITEAPWDQHFLFPKRAYHRARRAALRG